MPELVQYQVYKEGYGLIRLNRLEKHNAISSDMAKELLEKIQTAKNTNIKFLVITAAGERMFCPGGDLITLQGDLNSDEAFSKLYQLKEGVYDLVSFLVLTICLLYV